MNAIEEEAFLFAHGDARLVGIVAKPPVSPSPGCVGVLIVVGGPQYRVGSHRQFVLLSRTLAARGFPVMRFDFAGMGDSSGPEQVFTDRADEIRAAIDAFVDRVPHIDAIAIWGLCDAASAALIYAPNDERVRYLVLLNPWARSESGLARAQLQHYYTRRLADRAFWRSLLAGKVGLLRALAGFARTMRVARAEAIDADCALTFQTRMARGWKRFTGDILLIRSGDDLTAREFVDHATRDAEWAGLLTEQRVAHCELADADHTFSRAAWRDRVADETTTWLSRRSQAASSHLRLEDAMTPIAGRAGVVA